MESGSWWLSRVKLDLVHSLVTLAWASKDMNKKVNSERLAQLIFILWFKIFLGSCGNSVNNWLKFFTVGKYHKHAFIYFASLWPLYSQAVTVFGEASHWTDLWVNTRHLKPLCALIIQYIVWKQSLQTLEAMWNTLHSNLWNTTRDWLATLYIIL